MTVVVSKRTAAPTGDTKSWPLRGIERSRNVRSTKGLDLVGYDNRASYAGIYSSQPWIFALVNKLSRNIARLPLATYRVGADGEAERRARLHARQHPLPMLFRRPYPRGSKFKLVEWAVGSLGVYGHGLWWKYRPRPGAPPQELWPLDWRYVEMKTGEDAPIEHYEYQGPAGRKIFLPEDLVHFEWWSPAGVRGTSPLEPLRVTLSLEDAGRRYAVASFTNGVRPSGALVTPKPVVGDQREELKAEIEQMHTNPDNAFRMMLLDGGLDWKAFSHTAQEAETIQHRKLNQIEACAVYDMPPPMVHILDKATFSNIDEQHQMLYVDTIGPYLGLLEDTIFSQLVDGEPSFEAAVNPDTSDLEEIEQKFDLTELLRPDIAVRMEAWSKGRQAGALTINDVRAREGMPAINHPAANAVLIPLNYEVVGNEGDAAALGLQPRSDPATAALLQLAAQLSKSNETTAAELKDLADRVLEQASSSGERETAGAILELAKQLAEREPIVVNVPEQKAPELRIEPGAIELKIEAPAAPDVVHLEGTRTKRIELEKDPETGRTTGAVIVEE